MAKFAGDNGNVLWRFAIRHLSAATYDIGDGSKVGYVRNDLAVDSSGAIYVLAPVASNDSLVDLVPGDCAFDVAGTYLIKIESDAASNSGGGGSGGAGAGGGNSVAAQCAWATLISSAP